MPNQEAALPSPTITGHSQSLREIHRIPKVDNGDESARFLAASETRWTHPNPQLT